MSFLKRKIATVVLILSYYELNSAREEEPMKNAGGNQENITKCIEVKGQIEQIVSLNMDLTASQIDSLSSTNLAKVQDLKKALSSASTDQSTRLIHQLSQTIFSAPDNSTNLVSMLGTTQDTYSIDYLPQTIFSEIPLYDSFNYDHDRNNYWQDKLDKLQEMIGDISSNEDDILMLLQEIISHAPEKYRYEAYNSFQSYKPPKKILLLSDEDDELSVAFVYIPECLIYGSKPEKKEEEKKEEVVIHLTSDPKLFDKVFRVVPIRERPKVIEASRIRREKQEAEYREQQRIHAEQYKAKERALKRALKRANGKDMIFDPRVRKRAAFEDYLRLLFLSQLAEARARAR